MENYKTKPLKCYCCWVIGFRFNSQIFTISVRDRDCLYLAAHLHQRSRRRAKVDPLFLCMQVQWSSELCLTSGNSLVFSFILSFILSDLLRNLRAQISFILCSVELVQNHLSLNSSLRPRNFPVPTGSPSEEQVEVKDSSLTALPTFPCITSLFCYMFF